LAVRLVGVNVLVRPPHACSETFVGGCNPWTREAVAGPHEAAIPRRALRDGRLPVVIDRNRFLRAGRLTSDESDEEGIAIAPSAELGSILDDAVDDERELQIDLHLTRGLENAIRDRVVAGDAAVRRIHLDVQIVERRVPPRALGRVGSADGVGVREYGFRGLRRRGLRRDTHRRHCKATAKEDYLPGAHGGPAGGCGPSHYLR